MVRERSSPPFIGRRAEVEALTAALSDAVAGRPRAVFVAGEAGVGKSRLVAHFLGRPACRGTWTISGVCVDISGESLPYGPIRDGLRSFFRNTPDVERTRILDSVPAGIHALLSEPESAGRQQLAEGSSPQVPTLEAFLDLAAEAAAVRPLVIVVEDLHWADSSSLACLNFLLTQMRSERVLLVGTYRSDELHRTHRLRPWLAAQLRKDLVELLDLPRFDRIETGQLVEAVVGSEPPADTATEIYQRSEGNAFFVEELARTPGTGAALPMTLREILLATIRVLPDNLQALLRLAAVGGRSIDPDAVSHVAQMDRDTMFALLRELLARNIVVTETGHGEFAFRHALLHEVALSEVLPGERELLHAAYAEYLLGKLGDERGDSEELAQIAHHLLAARDANKALIFANRAGGAALNVGAFTTAHEHFERALSLWPSTDHNAISIDRPELLEHAASAAHLAGDDDRAIAFVLAALDEIDSKAEPIRAGLLYERLGWYHFTGGPRREAFTAYEHALDLIPADPPSQARARILAAYARLLMLWSRHNDAIQIGEEAVRVAKATDARREEGMALNPIGIAMVSLGEPERGLEYLRRSLTIAKESGDYDEASRGHINLGEALAQMGRTKEAIDVWLEGYERAHRAGLRFRIGGFLLCNIAELLYHIGDWAAMKTMLEEAERWMAPGLNESFWLTLSGRLAMGTGDFTAARDCLERAALQARDGNPQLAVESLRDLAELALMEERLDESHDRILSALAFTADNSEIRNSGSLLMLGLRAEAERAAAPGANDASRQAAVHRAYELIAVARRPEWDPMSPSEEARPGVAAVAGAAATTCRAELSRLEGPSDTELWALAASQWSACDRKYNEAYARWREAEALALAGRRRSAENVLRRSAALANALGARPLKNEIEMLSRRARLELEPEVPVTEAAQEPSPAADLGLTQRELEVLKHLGLGRTNREIAALLFISPKTASVHVSNIMRKLGVSNRIAAARAAHRAGLTDERPIHEPR